MKMKYVDYAILAVFALVLVACYFFWGCRIDLYVTILAGVLVIASGVLTYLQYKKIEGQLEASKEMELE